jgi:lactoylglutathione lyase
MRADHVNIRVADPARSLAFYRALGLELCGCLRLDGLYNLYLAPEGGEHCLELTVNEQPGDGWSTAAGTGHFAFAVGDLDATVARLADQGIQPERPPYHPGDRDEWRICFVQDPDANRVELVEGDRMVTPQDPLPPGVS